MHRLHINLYKNILLLLTEEKKKDKILKKKVAYFTNQILIFHFF